MLVGFAGVAALVGIDIGGRGAALAGAGAILVAAVCYAIGPMIIKRRLSDVDPLGPVAASLAIATLLLTPFAAADLPRRPRRGRRSPRWRSSVSSARRSPSSSSSG